MKLLEGVAAINPALAAVNLYRYVFCTSMKGLCSGFADEYQGQSHAIA